VIKNDMSILILATQEKILFFYSMIGDIHLK